MHIEEPSPMLRWISSSVHSPITRSKFSAPVYRIQEIRLIQALVEAKWEIGVPTNLAQIFATADCGYVIKPEPTAKGSAKLDIHINHEIPSTSVNGVSRHLIFPEGYFTTARSRWTSNRPVRMSFNGIYTASRIRFFNRLMDLYGQKQGDAMEKRIRQLSGFLPGRFKAAAANYLLKMNFPGDQIEFTTRGRSEAVKVQDPRYLNSLLSATYTICPDGDYVWTYRFFEATASGAAPIVESISRLYSMYFYNQTEDALRPAPVDALHHNYELSLRLMTCKQELLELHG